MRPCNINFYKYNKIKRIEWTHACLTKPKICERLSLTTMVARDIGKSIGLQHLISRSNSKILSLDDLSKTLMKNGRLVVHRARTIAG